MTSPTVLVPPRWMHVPDHVMSFGDEVADLADSVGMTLDPEQRLVLDAAYAVNERARLVATEVGCSAPRQNVKTHVGKAAALGDLVLFEEPECLWTAHLRATSDDAFRNAHGTGLADLFDSYDFLRRLVDRDGIKDSDGEKSITLRPSEAGGPRPTLEFVTRSERGGRGLSGRRVTFDEALFLKPSMLGAMIPVLSAQSVKGAVQVRYLGSPGLLTSQVWRDIRDRGRRGNARALAWFEWAARQKDCELEECEHRPGTAGCALDDPELIAEANLALHRRISLDYVLSTERNMPPEEFMRERMGWWQDPPEGGGVIDLEEWARLRLDVDPAENPPDRPVLAVEVALDRSRATIGAAWERDGVPHVEVVEAHAGVDWVVPRLVNHLVPEYSVPLVVLDGATEAGSLAEPLERAGVEVLKLTGAQRAAACAGIFDLATARWRETEDRRLTHNGDPQLAEAIAAARWKSTGDGARVFTRAKSARDIAPLYSVTLARYGLEQGTPVSIFFYDDLDEDDEPDDTEGEAG